MRLVTIVGCVLLAASAARAEELSARETAWVIQCTEALASKSEAMQRGALKALDQFGVQVVPVMVAATSPWDAEGPWALFRRALQAFGAKEAREALLACRDTWPKAHAKRLTELAERLEGAVLDAPDVEVDAKVRELLDAYRGKHSYVHGDPYLRNVTKFGRAAIPTLVGVLRDETRHPSFGFVKNAAADSLKVLLTREDLPLLAELLAEGVLGVAPCLDRMRGDEARDALLVPLRKGFLDHDLLKALEAYGRDEVALKALLNYLDDFGEAGDFSTGAAAEFLGKSGYSDAVPVLKKLAAAGPDEDILRPVATALVLLGEKEAIPILIDILASGRSSSGSNWQAHRAGETLNEIIGRRVYVGSVGRSGGGNYDEAAETFRKWWEKKGDRLKYDAKRRRWTGAR